MTLITAMLIMIYKRKNEIGYSDAKFCFKIEMEAWIIALSIAIREGELSKFSDRYRIRTRIPEKEKASRKKICTKQSFDQL